MGAPRGLGRPNCLGHGPALEISNGLTVFEALFVALDGLLLIDFLSSSFDVVLYFFLERLGVDFELPNRSSDPQK